MIMTNFNKSTNETEKNNTRSVLSERATAILEEHWLSDYFSSNFDISSLSEWLQRLIAEFRSRDIEPSDIISEKAIRSMLESIALTMVSQIRNESTRTQISEALRWMNLELGQFSTYEQLQLIKFRHIANDAQWAILMEYIRTQRTEDGRSYIQQIKSEHLHNKVREHADRFEHDSPDLEVKKKGKKRSQVDANSDNQDDADQTRKGMNNKAAQIIADHEKKEWEFAKKDEQFQKRRESIDTLQIEVNEIEEVIETIEELRDSVLMKIIDLKKHKAIKIIKRKVSELEKNNTFSKPLKIVQIDSDFKVIIDDKVHSINDYAHHVSIGEILVNDLDISESNLNNLEKELKKKQKGLNRRRSKLEQSTNDLEAKKQAYHNESNDKVENAKQQLEIFEARKRKLKELSEGSREWIIWYAHDLTANTEFNYQVKTLPDALRKLIEKNNELIAKKNELTKQLQDMAANPSWDRGDVSMEDLRQEIIGIDISISINEIEIDRIDEKMDNDPLFENAREEERKKIQDLENIVADIQRELDDKLYEHKEARRIASEHQTATTNILSRNDIDNDEIQRLIQEYNEHNKETLHIGQSAKTLSDQAKVLENRLNEAKKLLKIILSPKNRDRYRDMSSNVLEEIFLDALGIEKNVNNIDKEETDEDENTTPETYEFNKVVYAKVEGKKHTYKHPDPSKEQYIIVPTNGSPIRLFNNKIISINSIEYGRAIWKTKDDNVARASNEKWEYARIKIAKSESYTTNIPFSENIVIVDNTLQCIIEKNWINILASLPLTENNSWEITLRDEDAVLTIPQSELLNKLNEITSKNNQVAVTPPTNPPFAPAPSSPGDWEPASPFSPADLEWAERLTNKVIVTKEEAQETFLKYAQDIDENIDACVIEWYNNGFLVTFKCTEGEINMDIWCNIEDKENRVDFNSFMCSSNDEKFNSDYLNEFRTLSDSLRTYYNKNWKLKTIEVAKEGQPSQTLWLTYKNDNKWDADSSTPKEFHIERVLSPAGADEGNKTKAVPIDWYSHVFQHEWGYVLRDGEDNVITDVYTNYWNNMSNEIEFVYGNDTDTKSLKFNSTVPQEVIIDYSDTEGIKISEVQYKWGITFEISFSNNQRAWIYITSNWSVQYLLDDKGWWKETTINVSWGGISLSFLKDILENNEKPKITVEKLDTRRLAETYKNILLNQVWFSKKHKDLEVNFDARQWWIMTFYITFKDKTGLLKKEYYISWRLVNSGDKIEMIIENNSQNYTLLDLFEWLLNYYKTENNQDIKKANISGLDLELILQQAIEQTSWVSPK